MAAGYPHLNITEERRGLAFECCLLYEVVTKRIVALDDIRKGLAEVKVSGISFLDLLARFPALLMKKVFPPYTGKVDAKIMRLQIRYEDNDDPRCLSARQFFEQYINELEQRGIYTA